MKKLTILIYLQLIVQLSASDLTVEGILKVTDKIGVNVSDPSATLHINGSALFENDQFSGKSIFVGDNNDIISSGGWLHLNRTGNNLVAVGHSQGANFYVNGNVGIGTTPSDSKLEIKGNHFFTRLQLLSDHYDEGIDSITTANLNIWASEPTLTWSGAGIGNNVSNGVYDSAAETWNWGIQRQTTTRGGSYIRLLDNQILLNTISSSGVDQSSVAINGDLVGIGTTTPLARLEVEKPWGSGGAEDVAAFFGGRTANSGRYNTFIIGHTLGAGFGNDTDDAGFWINWQGYEGGHTRYRNFFVGDGKGNSLLMCNGSQAAVGIGTTNPEKTLHVVGDSKFEGKVILEPQGDIPMFGE